MNPFRSFLKHLFRRDLVGFPARSPLQARTSAPPSARSPLTAGASAPPFVVINGTALTKEELEDRVARHKQSLQQQGPAKPQRPRHTLKLIGYWAPTAHPSWPASAEDGQAPWPDIHRAVRPGWRSAEREHLVAYLRNGHRCDGALEFSACRFACRVTYSILGSGELTGGEWVSVARFSSRELREVPSFHAGLVEDTNVSAVRFSSRELGDHTLRNGRGSEE
jgi:hypothetical protein